MLRATKPQKRKNKILFINAVNEYARISAQSFLLAEHQQKILKAYQAFQDQPGFTRVATLDDIAALDYTLAIPRYVSPAATGGTGNADTGPGLAEALTAWRRAAAQTDAAFAELLDTLTQEVNK